MMHVPFGGDTASIVALLGKELDVIIAPPTAGMEHVKTGNLKALAPTSAERLSGLPSVTTVAEQGVSG